MSTTDRILGAIFDGLNDNLKQRIQTKRNRRNEEYAYNRDYNRRLDNYNRSVAEGLYDGHDFEKNNALLSYVRQMPGLTKNLQESADEKYNFMVNNGFDSDYAKDYAYNNGEGNKHKQALERLNLDYQNKSKLADDKNKLALYLNKENNDAKLKMKQMELDNENKKRKTPSFSDMIALQRLGLEKKKFEENIKALQNNSGGKALGNNYKYLKEQSDLVSGLAKMQAEFMAMDRNDMETIAKLEATRRENPEMADQIQDSINQYMRARVQKKQQFDNAVKEYAGQIQLYNDLMGNGYTFHVGLGNLSKEKLDERKSQFDETADLFNSITNDARAENISTPFIQTLTPSEYIASSTNPVVASDALPLDNMPESVSLTEGVKPLLNQIGTNLSNKYGLLVYPALAGGKAFLNTIAGR